MQGHFVQVPPPERVPVHEIAETLGIVDGLRAERSDSQYRCSNCSKMQQSGSWMVWVPDSVQNGDPEWSITEAARQNAYNGMLMLSGWCLRCAPKKPRSQRIASSSAKWWQFWK